uniref:Uncharacterized protein n=1 Tax=Apteryx owenii TaxID=8824 RepID=A0A8B9Q9S1_APTOW
MCFLPCPVRLLLYALLLLHFLISPRLLTSFEGESFIYGKLALQSMIRSREENITVSSSAVAEETQKTLGQMDNEAAINQTELHLSLQDHEEEEEEEEEESDS